MTIKISANYELGLQIIPDFDYYRAFLKICDELVDRDGRFRLPIMIPTRQLMRYAGKVDAYRASLHGTSRWPTAPVREMLAEALTVAAGYTLRDMERS